MTPAEPYGRSHYTTIYMTYIKMTPLNYNVGGRVTSGGPGPCHPTSHTIPNLPTDKSWELQPDLLERDFSFEFSKVETIPRRRIGREANQAIECYRREEQE